MGSQQVAVADDPAGSTIQVEVLAFRVTERTTLAYRELAGTLGGGWHPDKVARDLLGLSQHTVGHLLHSTSWRHEAQGRIVLTYACCPDPRQELPARALHVNDLARGDGPASPSPAVVETDQVAAHAVRHLAFLAHTDPAAARVIEAVPGLATELTRWTPAPAGQLPVPA